MELLFNLLAATSPEMLVDHHLVATPHLASAIFETVEPLRTAHGLEVLDDRSNGRRFDTRVTASDGRAWLVVIWASADSPTAVESVTVYERPPAFAGRPGGLVIVLNGPSSVGKSSLMRAFAAQSVTPYASFDEPWLGQLPAAHLAWPESLGPAADGLLAGIAAAARVGNQFVLSAAGIAQARFRAALDGVPTLSVGLDASIEELVRRQLVQADKFGRLAEESVGIHEGWDYDLRIDTEVHTPEQAAALLEDLVRTLDQ